MISSPILSALTKANADGDYRKSTGLESKTKRTSSRQPLKRMKTSPSMETNTLLPATSEQQNQADDFFLQPHAFSDLTLLIQGRSDGGKDRRLPIRSVI